LPVLAAKFAAIVLALTLAAAAATAWRTAPLAQTPDDAPLDLDDLRSIATDVAETLGRGEAPPAGVASALRAAADSAGYDDAALFVLRPAPTTLVSTMGDAGSTPAAWIDAAAAAGDAPWRTSTGGADAVGVSITTANGLIGGIALERGARSGALIWGVAAAVLASAAAGVVVFRATAEEAASVRRIASALDSVPTDGAEATPVWEGASDLEMDAFAWRNRAAEEMARRAMTERG